MKPLCVISSPLRLLKKSDKIFFLPRWRLFLFVSPSPRGRYVLSKRFIMNSNENGDFRDAKILRTSSLFTFHFSLFIPPSPRGCYVNSKRFIMNSNENGDFRDAEILRTSSLFTLHFSLFTLHFSSRPLRVIVTSSKEKGGSVFPPFDYSLCISSASSSTSSFGISILPLAVSKMIFSLFKE